MSNAFLIEAGDIGLGLAVRQQRGFRFYAAISELLPLDGQVFPKLHDVERAARQRFGSSRRKPSESIFEQRKAA